MGKSVFRGFGSFIPGKEVTNEDFHSYEFYDEHNDLLSSEPAVITRKFQ